MTVSPENILLIGSVLVFVSILLSKPGYKYGVPALLLFLLLGMFAGVDGLGISFDSPRMAQFIGMVALSIILFSGGMDTKYKFIRPVAGEGIVLATVGVLLTALITGAFIYFVCNYTPLANLIQLSFLESLLLASIMSSTDSASVFAILRSKNISLKQNLRPLLELESGSNDPMAYLLTVVLLQLLAPSGGIEVSAWNYVGMFFYQFIVGALVGFLLGKIYIWILNKIGLSNDGLYMVVILVFTFFTFSFTDFIQGNGFLAVYLAGLVVGNAPFVHKKSIIKFYDGLTWLCQIVMFLSLGLLVNPKELIPLLGIGVLIAVFMILVSRPLSVFASLLPFRKLTTKARVYTSWVGLRGAVPIIFATYVLVADIPHAREIFNIVFIVTIVSLVVQGTTVSSVAKFLGLTNEDKTMKKRKSEFGMDFDFSDEIKTAMSEVKISKESLRNGNQLMHIPIPDNSLVVMVKRNNQFFIPRGSTILMENDVLLIITDDEEALRETYKQLGLKGYSIKTN